MSGENSTPASPDPRDLLRSHIVSLEEKAAGLADQLAAVNGELKQYRTALAALTGKPAESKKTVTRAVVRGEVVAVLTEAPERTSTRKALDEAVRERLKSSGYKLNGITKLFQEALRDSAFTLDRNKVSLSEH